MVEGKYDALVNGDVDLQCYVSRLEVKYGHMS